MVLARQVYAGAERTCYVCQGKIYEGDRCWMQPRHKKSPLDLYKHLKCQNPKTRIAQRVSARNRRGKK